MDRNDINIIALLLVATGIFAWLMWQWPQVPQPSPISSAPVVQEKEKVKEEDKKDVLVPKQKIVRKKAQRSADGYLPIRRLNRDPYKKFKTPAKDRGILEKERFTETDINEFFTLLGSGSCKPWGFVKGTEFLWMSHGNARITERLRATWEVAESGVLCQLTSGRNVAVMDTCENLGEVSALPVKKEEVVLPPPPVVVEVPPVPEVETPPAPPVVAEEKPQPVEVPVVVEVPPVFSTPAEKGKKCLVDPNLFVGHEREPRHNGNSMEATDLSAAFYCLVQGDDPNVSHGLGINFKGSWFEGRVNHGAGKFTGYLLAGGPAYKRIQKDKWDMEIRMLLGVLHERFEEGGYRNHRENLVVGPSFIFNDYRRRSAGYKWFHETQLYIEWLFPFSSDLSHSWQGKPLSGEPENLNFRFFIGVKEWLYHNPWAEPYFQAGIFLEDPLAASASLRLGVAVPGRWAGIGIGPDFDIKNGGGPVLGWGPWLDIRTAVDVWRTNHRAGNLVDVTKIKGASMTDSGIIMIPMEEDTGTQDVSSQTNGGSANNAPAGSDAVVNK